MENNKDKKIIEKSMSQIKQAIRTEKNNLPDMTDKAKNDKQDYFLLKKIVFSPSSNKLKTQIDKDKINENVKPKNISNKKNTNHIKKLKKSHKKTLQYQTSKNKDPVSKVVDREIKPIIKKWINKNLRAFVKGIVIEEMKGISKATEKPSRK